MAPRWTDFGSHIARLGIGASGLALAAHVGSTAGMLVASVAIFLAAFTFNHDLSHGALGLPHGCNEIALAVAGSLMLMSGHAIRATHLRHHLRPLAADDYEGAAANMTLPRALLSSLAQVIATRRAGYRIATHRQRAWQHAESAVTLAVAAVLLASGSRPLTLFAVVAVTAQITMPVWAAHIPHNAPEWLVRVARRFAFTGSSTILSLAYHDFHHANPRLPCRRLDEAFDAASGQR